MLVWRHLDDISHRVERCLEVGEKARLESRRHQDVDARRYLLLLRDGSTDVPSVATVRGRDSRILQARDIVGIRGQWEGAGVRSVHVHSDAHFELL